MQVHQSASTEYPFNRLQKRSVGLPSVPAFPLHPCTLNTTIPSTKASQPLPHYRLSGCRIRRERARQKVQASHATTSGLFCYHIISQVPATTPFANTVTSPAVIGLTQRRARRATRTLQHPNRHPRESRRMNALSPTWGWRDKIALQRYTQTVYLDHAKQARLATE